MDRSPDVHNPPSKSHVYVCACAYKIKTHLQAPDEEDSSLQKLILEWTCVRVSDGIRQLFKMFLSPDDDDDAVKDVVRVAEIIKESKGSKFQDHLQGKHAGKHHIADLQNVG